VKANDLNSFVDPNAALAFYTTAMQQGITIRQRRAKIGWGRPSGPPLAGIAMCVQAGGSRNVYIGGIDDMETFEYVKVTFSERGMTSCSARSAFDTTLDSMARLNWSISCARRIAVRLASAGCHQTKVFSKGFVNFTDIACAIQCIEGMKFNPDYAQFKIAL
jgi:hypothetical protein